VPLFRRLHRTDEQERRKRNLLIIGGILVLLVVATIFEVGIRHPRIPFASNLIVFALFNLNLVVFLLLLVLLFRNLVKLYFERRHKVIGARFKAKLVLTSSRSPSPGHPDLHHRVNFITTSIEGWFIPRWKAARPAMDVAWSYYQMLESTAATAATAARWSARACSRTGAATPSPRTHRAAGAARRRGGHRLGRQGQELAHVKNPGLGIHCAREASRGSQALAGQRSHRQELDNGDMIQAVVPVRGGEEQA
jgi:two-component system nitrogen regulation sensor histidine kinase NtrY